MRKLKAVMLSSLDGFAEGPNREFGEWAEKFEDDEFKEYSHDQFAYVGTILLGRVTYDLGTSYWPTNIAVEKGEHPSVIELMNGMPKVVFSKTLQETKWPNSTIVSDDLIESVRAMKEGDGKDLLLIGSANVRVQLVNAGLVDELRIQYMPIFLGQGRSLFGDLEGQLILKQLRTLTFASGNVQIDYALPTNGA